MFIVGFVRVILEIIFIVYICLDIKFFEIVYWFFVLFSEFDDDVENFEIF